MSCVNVVDERVRLPDWIILSANSPPLPPYHALGRPLPSSSGLMPLELERWIERFTATCRRHLARGGVIRISGDWRSETAVYRMLSISMARLRRLDLTVEAAGEVFVVADAPPRPDAQIAILPEATAYGSLGSWVTRSPGTVNVLVGLDADWSRRVDLAFKVPPEPWLYADKVRELRRLWEDADRQPALTAAAMGVDVPSETPGRYLVCVETSTGSRTSYKSVEGQWIAWQALGDLVRESDIVRTARWLEGSGEVVRRLAYRRRKRAGPHQKVVDSARRS